jgi:hypothetical protein
MDQMSRFPNSWFTDLLEKFYGCHIDLDHPPADYQQSPDAPTDP